MNYFLPFVNFIFYVGVTHSDMSFIALLIILNKEVFTFQFALRNTRDQK